MPPRRQIAVRCAASVLLGLALLALPPTGPCAETTILSEDFEGVFPSGGWTVGDLNTNGVVAYWDDVDAAFGGTGTHGGNWKGYCAGFGYGGGPAAPTYRNAMSAFMAHPLDLTGAAGATLKFWFRIPSIETGYDRCRVVIDAVELWSSDAPNADWTEATIDLSAHVGALRTLQFEFVSDPLVTGQGWYVDDILVTTSGAPTNDNFDSAQPLSGPSGSVSGSNVGATAEPGEPANNGRTVWYRWTAPRTGRFFFRTGGSGFDTVLGVYTGEQVTGLTLMALNDNGEGEGAQSRLDLSAQFGTTYSVRVDGAGGAQGKVTLRWGPVGAGAAEVRLNKLVYTPGSLLTATVSGVAAGLPPDALRLFVTAGSNDVEVLPLIPTARPGEYVTASALPVELAAGANQFVQLDGRLTLRPNEKFTAMFMPYSAANGPAEPPPEVDPLFAKLAADFGLMEAAGFAGAPVQVVPQIAMTDDELNVPPGGKPIGTVAALDGLAVQVPLDELVFYPRSADQLADFLSETQGTVLAEESFSDQPNAPARVYLVRVNRAVADVAHLSQLRALGGDQDMLLASSPATLQVYALALYYQLEGFVVGLNPRLQFMGAPSTKDGATDARIDFMKDDAGAVPAVTSFVTPPVRIRECWAYTALWDADAKRIPVAFLDMGFAPNHDFRGYNPSAPDLGIFQRNAAGAVGSAVGPPTVGASFFGPRLWHGNGVVTTAGGVLNNGWGSAGTGGQVVVPMLYKMDLKSYALDMGSRMKQATDDGATLINISAGYPCRVKTYTVPDISLCSVGGRAALCTELSAVLAVGVAAVCSIPIVGIWKCPEAVGAASAAVAACYATLLAGDPSGPLKGGVDYALAHGVTVVSIAGNKPSSETLGVLCDLVRCGAQDVSDFEVVPGTLPGVICVGAANNTSPFGNVHYYGARVDIWAPINTTYFAPPTVDTVTGPSEQLQNEPFGGTSAAAPYISGIIAMMQAINPTLDPRTPGLTADQRAAIPGRIRDLLVSTATPASSLPADPTGQRRNLVNAYAALQAATPDSIRAFWPMAYDGSLGFDETDTLNDDKPSTATVVSATVTTTKRGTILSLPAQALDGRTFADVDWYVWETPSVPGIYANGRIRLQYPAGYGKILINNEEGTLLPAAPGSTEETREFLIPETANDCRREFRVSGTSGSDNVYLISFLEAKRKDYTLAPDRYDRPDLNPPGWPNNDLPDRAIPLGTSVWPWPFWVWPLTAETTLYTNWEFYVSGLTLHSKSDQDWFRLGLPPSGCSGCAVLRVEATEGITVAVHYEKLVSDTFTSWPIIGADESSVEFWASTLDCRFPLLIHLFNNTCTPIAYDLKITWTAYSRTGCRVVSERAPLDGTVRLEFPTPVSDPPGWGTPITFLDPSSGPWSYTTDGAGRITEPTEAAIRWRGAGAFRLQARVATGASMWLKLFDRSGTLVAHSATPDLVPNGMVAAAAQNSPPFLPAVQDGAETLILELNLPQLAPDTYVLSLSYGRYHTPVELLLPRDAISDGSASLEDRLAVGFVPGDLDGDGALTPADLQLASLFANQQANPTPDQLRHGDANGNNLIDPDDVQRLQEALAGQRDLFADWPTPIFRVPLSRPATDLDSDGDGLPDWWEYSFGLDPYNPADAQLDSDGDGLTNLAEFQTFTSPRDRQDCLRVATVAGAPNQFQVRFQAAPNVSYAIEYRSALGGSAGWHRLADFEPQPYYRTIDVNDRVDGQEQRFYRLVSPAAP